MGFKDAPAIPSLLYEGVFPVKSDSLPSDLPVPTKPEVKSAALGFTPIPRKRPQPSRVHIPSGFSQVSAPPAAIISAAPIIYSAEPKLASKPLFKAPPTTLEGDDDDVNGFKSSAAGLKAARNKRKKKKRQGQDPSTQFTADYDPSKPNDYMEYKAYAQRQKEEAKEAKRQAQRRKEIQAAAALAGDGSGDESDYASSASDEPRNNAPTKARFFAPPTSYDEQEIPGITPQPVNDYAAVTQDSAFAPSRTETGDEAYARRLAMSQQQATQPPPTAPSFVSASTPSEKSNLPPAILAAQAKAKAIAERLGKLGAPGAASAPATAAPTMKRPRDEEKSVATSQNTQADLQSSSHDFASRLMAKFGYEKGKGLGAAEDGMTTALRLQSTSNKKAKGQDAGNPPAPTLASGKGMIVSEKRTAKEASDKLRFGEPSKIVCLTNMVGRQEAEDADLPGEIAEEASKQGVVQRCFVHQMPFNTPEEESVRVFLIFSGLAGAWKTATEFDGRFFNGRTVRARFYDPAWVERGIYGMAFPEIEQDNA